MFLKSLQQHQKIIFPKLELADEQGLLCHGGNIDVVHVLSAYEQGIFPWPSQDIPVPLWFAPDPRGVIDFANIKLAKSFIKWRKKNLFRVTFNQDFRNVIKMCRDRHQDGVWITDEMMTTYSELFDLGLAYSVECWKESTLVGGLYGISLGSFFSAESMFFLEDNASKLSLIHLVEKLSQSSITWLDTQMVSPVVENFGGHYIPRVEFMKRLKKCDFGLKRDQFIY